MEGDIQPVAKFDTSTELKRQILAAFLSDFAKSQSNQHIRRLNWEANLNGIWFIGWLKAALVMENPEKDSAMKPWSWKTVK